METTEIPLDSSPPKQEGITLQSNTLNMQFAFRKKLRWIVPINIWEHPILHNLLKIDIPHNFDSAEEVQTFFHHIRTAIENTKNLPIYMFFTRIKILEEIHKLLQTSLDASKSILIAELCQSLESEENTDTY